MLNNVKIGARLIISFIIVGIITAIVGSVGLYSISKLSRLNANINQNNVLPLMHVSDLRENYQRFHLNVLYFINAKNDTLQERYNKRILETSQTIDAILERIKTGVKGFEKRKQAYNAFVQAKANYDQFVKSVIDYTKAKNTQAVERLLNSGQAITLAGATAKALQELNKHIVGDSHQLKEESEKLASSSEVVSISIVVIGVILAIVFGIIMASAITKPIKVTVNFADTIARRDLTFLIDEKYMQRKDEIGVLAKSLKNMQITLIDIVSQMNDTASNLAAGSEEISASAQSLAEGAQSQAASVEQTSASMEELTSAVIQVSDNTDEVNAQVQGLSTTANQSAGLVENAIQSMNRINDNSQTISEIIGVINDVADQTNLLALNAAIEAARAGEHGRGFAVVADEISKLADKSTQNAKEIEKLIKQSMKDVETGVKVVKQTGDAFNEIIHGVEKNNSSMQDITSAVRQQKIGAREVQKAIEEINDVTQSISSSAEEMAASTEELQSQAVSLKEIVETFKVDLDVVTQAKTEEKKQVKKIVTTTTKGITEYHQPPRAVETTKPRTTVHSAINGKVEEVVKWDDSYSVNVNQLDNQHKRWLQYINELHTAMSQGKSKIIMQNILEKMMEYTRVHLSTEEDLLKRNNYPEYTEHKAIHDKFTGWVTDVYKKYKTDPHASLSLEVMSKIKDWLLNHIKTVDKKYSDYLNSKGIR